MVTKERVWEVTFFSREMTVGNNAWKLRADFKKPEARSRGAGLPRRRNSAVDTFLTELDEHREGHSPAPSNACART